MFCQYRGPRTCRVVAFVVRSTSHRSCPQLSGLGIQPPNPSWGADLGRGREFMELGIHQVLFPGLMIILAVMGFNLLGDGLRDYFDPRIRKKN